MANPLNILMVAAENGALAGGKVGGIGDVVREVPQELAQKGCEVTVVTPAYGAFHRLAGARRLAILKVDFRGVNQLVELYEVRSAAGTPAVRHWVLEHSLFGSGGAGVIYCDDLPETPFATDANKFALFAAAVAEMVEQGHCGKLDVLHLHDWHAALVLVLRQFDPGFEVLKGVRCVYTIHNLGLQGVRPFSGHPSSLHSWYPSLHYDRALLADPRWPDCLNPMAVGIRLADAVHAVSPTYAREILLPSEVGSRGYYGGEGLEQDLVRAHGEKRLHGILNGCDYTAALPEPLEWEALVAQLRDQLLRWVAQQPQVRSAHFVAGEQLPRWEEHKPGILVTSVGRITEQKAQLLRQVDENGRPALAGILETLGPRGVYIFLGSGDPELELFLTQINARFDNFIFLRGYSDALAQALYASGDLFLMPSSFEPCGISQMLALRAGQPCLVHSVGGLKDTVTDGVNGFAFNGDSLVDQAAQLVETFAMALACKTDKPKQWQKLRRAAAAARFSWQASIDRYIGALYLGE
ncbi:glycogen synthase [Exilibacterium tricleocarpae]|uniref:starch synthase n=1 Tax=Exilibacterium tricleocarpae TaxID=2591008 RepID=A0A545TS71_9GAMM|nr:glycogen/starch synthase [Exilibacterium tricleocarpae]TQV80065.1 glycogen synthase [Exilibacterium tricleocarpae]